MDAYTNLLQLRGPRRLNSTYAYPWGDVDLLISGRSGPQEAYYELSSTDIVLLKHHPAAISARNLLKCLVGEMFEAGGRICVGLLCGNEKLVETVVREAVQELG